MKKTIKKIMITTIAVVTMITMVPSITNAAHNIYGYDGIIRMAPGFVATGSMPDVTDSHSVKNVIEIGHNPKATYSVESSNNNILKVSMNDKEWLDGQNNKGAFMANIRYVNLNGVGPGKATVTIKETLNGKTTIKGKHTLEVKGATLSATGNWKHDYPLGVKNNFTLLTILGRNNNAKYTYDVDKKGLEVYEEIEPSEGTVLIKLRATEPGVYKVTAKETYNGNTRILKTITINIHEMEIIQEYTMGLDYKPEGYSPVIKYWNTDYSLYYKSKDLQTMYQPMTSSDNIEYKNWKNSPAVVLRGNLVPVYSGDMEIEIYRILSEENYHITSKTDFKDLPYEMELVGTTKLKVVPAKAEIKK